MQPASEQVSDAPLVLTDVRDGIGTVTMNNPRRRNALSRPMLEALRQVMAQMRTNEQVRVVILAAEGPVFSSGHDLREVVGGEGVKELFDLCTSVMEGVRLMPKPVIAKVQGLASAAGCQLVASCDLVVASSEAAFQTPGLKIGLFCSTPMIPLSRAIPQKKAMEMLLTAEPISAHEAERAGLVNRVVAPTDLDEATRTLAAKVASYSTETIGIGKKAFYEQLQKDMSAAYRVGCDAMMRNAGTEDATEGMTAFLEKREPRWKH